MDFQHILDILKEIKSANYTHAFIKPYNVNIFLKILEVGGTLAGGGGGGNPRATLPLYDIMLIYSFIHNCLRMFQFLEFSVHSESS